MKGTATINQPGPIEKGDGIEEFCIQQNVDYKRMKEQWRPQTGFSLNIEKGLNDIDDIIQTTTNQRYKPFYENHEERKVFFYYKKIQIMDNYPMYYAGSGPRQDYSQHLHRSGTGLSGVAFSIHNKAKKFKKKKANTTNQYDNAEDGINMLKSGMSNYAVDHGRHKSRATQNSKSGQQENPDLHTVPNYDDEAKSSRKYIKGFNDSENGGKSMMSKSMGGFGGKRGISGLIKPAQPLHNRKFAKKYNWNVNLQEEGTGWVRGQKEGTTRMINNYDAKSFQIKNQSNNALRKTQHLHNELNSLATKKGSDWEDKMEGWGNFEKMSEKIVAKKSFFLDPTQNNPKIIKTSNKLYVI